MSKTVNTCAHSRARLPRTLNLAALLLFGASTCVLADDIHGTISSVASSARTQRHGGNGVAHPIKMSQDFTPPTPQGPGGTVASTVVAALPNNVVPQTDFQTHQLYPATLVRTYNSFYAGAGIFGDHWMSNFDVHLAFAISGKTCEAGPEEVLSSACVSYANAPSSSDSSITVTKVGADGSITPYSWVSGSSNWQDTTVVNGVQTPIPDAVDFITRNSSNGTWTITAKSGAVQTFDQYGFITSALDPTGIGWTFSYSQSGGYQYLQSATHTSGIVVRFAWNSNHTVSSVTDPGGNSWTYAYNGSYMLQTVTAPTSDYVTYYYEDGVVPGTLTGIADNGIRYNAYGYDSSGDLNLSKTYYGQYAPSTDVLTYTYSNSGASAGTVTVADGAGESTEYYYSQIQNQDLLTEVTQSGASDSPNTTSTTTYDSYGHPHSVTDERGYQTIYTYNYTSSTNDLATNITTGVQSGSTSEERGMQITWDYTHNRITNIETYGSSTSVPISNTAYTYCTSTSACANRLSQVVVTNLTPNGTANQTQTTTYAYSFYSSGMPEQIVVTSPAGQVTRNYNSSGDLTSVVNALGQTTTWASFNGLGLPANITDPNGYEISYTYDQKGRTKTVSRTVDGTSGTTTYTYDGLGDATGVTFADGGTFSYTYDATGRLLGKTNNVQQTSLIGGNPYENTAAETYQYDALGKLSMAALTATSTPYPNDTCTTSAGITPDIGPGGGGGHPCSDIATNVFQHNWTNDPLGRVQTDTGMNGQKLAYTYDGSGNVATVTGAMSDKTSFSYGAYGQRESMLDANSKTTTWSYDGAGNLASVGDPKGNATTYLYDGFGNRTEIKSPDTGTTTFTYDSDGRVTQMTRADGSSTTYIYDSLNRVTSISANNVSQSFTYDSCTNGKGRLCSFTDASGSTSYAYRLTGQVASQTSTVNGTAYTTSWTYDNRDRVTAIAYPGGTSVAYTYDGQGQSNITEVQATVGGVTTGIVNPFSYAGEGLGPMRSMAMGDTTTTSFGFDSDGRLTSISGLQALSYTYDDVNRLTGITNGNSSSLTQSYGYDALYRLDSVSAGVGNQSLSLDANGTPTSFTWGGITDTYSDTSINNHVASISGSRARSYTYDAKGNISAESGWRNYAYAFNGLNQLTSATPSGGSATSYEYNAFGQRVRKSGPAGSYNYLYSADGALLAETGQNSTSIGTQYIYANGLLIGLVKGSSVYFVHDDHLGRPDTATNATKTTVWQAQNTAFNRTVTTNSIGALNIGFPGQYYDSETGLWYNGYRYYDASTGRYLQSDPIGLGGGINTYAYAGNSPSMRIDPTGLDDDAVPLPMVTVTGQSPTSIDFGALGFFLNASGGQSPGVRPGAPPQGKLNNQNQQPKKKPSDGCPTGQMAQFAYGAAKFGSGMQAAGGWTAVGGAGVVSLGTAAGDDSVVESGSVGVAVGTATIVVGTAIQFAADAYLAANGDPMPLSSMSASQMLSDLLPPPLPSGDVAGSLGDAAAKLANPNQPSCGGQ